MIRNFAINMKEKYWSKFYAKKALLHENYRRGVHANMSEMNKIHDRISHNLITKSGILLDFGCGVGVLSAKLRKLDYTVVGIDLSEDLIHLANNQYGANISFLKGSINDMKFPDEYFQTVVACEVIQHLDHKVAIQTWLDKLKSGGQLIFSGPNHNFLKFRVSQRDFIYRIKAFLMKFWNLLLLGQMNKLVGIKLDKIVDSSIKSNCVSRISIDCSAIENKYNNFIVSAEKK